MKNTVKILLNSTRKVFMGDRVLPISKVSFDKLLKTLPKLITLCFDKVTGFQGRLLIANNFIQFVMKMNKNHGAAYTIKWLKACTVALQKWLGGDKLNSLREIEPNLPLPRLINGCPAIINRSDRFRIKHGDARITRFWHSLFSIYRVLSIPGKLKLETITAPYSGSADFNESLQQASLEWRWPSFMDAGRKSNLAPTTFHITGKASPSNVNSSFGLLTDVYHLLAHPEGGEVWFNILSYLQTVGQVWNTKKFILRLNDAKSIIEDLPEDSLPVKESMMSPFGQFATKHEAAGKIRVFALVDTVTQSVMKPLHLAVFDILSKIPNDGTFDQDAAVTRCSQKAIKYNQAFSFDLSAATDRLPVFLTGTIFESLFKISGLAHAWIDVMIGRNFSFSSKSAKMYNLDSSINYRYAVGQPMGCLSSWAGLAITHHWIMQYASKSIGCETDWEDRYEVLGDDIVIFDNALADSYTEIMKNLGLEINFSKSLISKNLPVFEFAKRTVVGDQLVSGITMSQIWSSALRSSLINNVYHWISKRYISKISTIHHALNYFKAKEKRDLKLFAATFQLGSQSKIERPRLISSIVDPRKGIYFDADTSFEVPVKTLIGMCRDKILGVESSFELSGLEARDEWVDENEELFVASVLQTAYHDIKVLATNHLDTLNEWSRKLVKESMLTPLQLSQVAGWFENVIIDDYVKDNDPYELEDEVEKLLIKQAKVRNIKMEDALKVYQKVQILSFKFKIPNRVTASQEEKMAAKSLVTMLNPLLMRGPHYWEMKSPQI
nr:MAG: putative RNA dependent RNA polymerase [Yunnan mito-like virus 51]